MSYFTHEFEDVIALHGVGIKKVLTYKVLFMPPHFEKALPFDVYPRLRVEGEIADVPVRGAWMPVGDGRRYFIVSPEVKKQTGFDVGDLVEMRFRIDDQDHVDVPRALQIALDGNAEANAAWEALTAGKKRMFTFHVASAKTEPTEARRVAEAIEAIGRGITLRDLQNERKSKK
ncbi:MAG: YdeI/OmpD-associated family protein [Pseudomonadota bacterium]